VEGYTWEDYGPHMYILEVDDTLPTQAFLVSGEPVPQGYSYGLTTMGDKTWVSIAPCAILRWRYLGKLGQVKVPPREAISSIPLGAVEVVAHSPQQFTLRVCGHRVAVCFTSRKVLVRVEQGDKQSADKLGALLRMHLFP
jgi:hypothetical protein